MVILRLMGVRSNLYSEDATNCHTWIQFSAQTTNTITITPLMHPHCQFYQEIRREITLMTCGAIKSNVWWGMGLWLVLHQILQGVRTLAFKSLKGSHAPWYRYIHWGNPSQVLTVCMYMTQRTIMRTSCHNSKLYQRGKMRECIWMELHIRGS